MAKGYPDFWGVQNFNNPGRPTRYTFSDTVSPGGSRVEIAKVQAKAFVHQIQINVAKPDFADTSAIFVMADDMEVSGWRFNNLMEHRSGPIMPTDLTVYSRKSNDMLIYYDPEFVFTDNMYLEIRNDSGDDDITVNTYYIISLLES